MILDAYEGAKEFNSRYSNIDWLVITTQNHLSIVATNFTTGLLSQMN